MRDFIWSAAGKVFRKHPDTTADAGRAELPLGQAVRQHRLTWVASGMMFSCNKRSSPSKKKSCYSQSSSIRITSPDGSFDYARKKNQLLIRGLRRSVDAMKTHTFERFGFALRLCLLVALSTTAKAGQQISTYSPIGFFTKVASRLLSSELGVDLNRIEVYPTNQYTPAVHRLLQVTANLYDATTNRDLTPYPYLPTVFRPLLRRDTNGAVWIVGFREVTNADLVTVPPQMVDLQNSDSRSDIPVVGTPFAPFDWNEPMAFNVPLIVGVKKGFPNFNEFSAQTQLSILRKLEFRRDPTGRIAQTNQMYVVGITNAFGVEAWNSYSNDFARDLTMTAAVEMKVVITNDTSTTPLFAYCTAWIATTNVARWPGFTDFVLPNHSFLVPLSNCMTLLPTSAWRPLQEPPFVPIRSDFLETGGFLTPRWWMIVSERLRFMLVDSTANRIVDYVNLTKTETPLDVFGQLIKFGGGQTNCGVTPDSNPWCTNVWQNSTSSGVTYGILSQIAAGRAGSRSPVYAEYLPVLALEYAIDNFRYQFGLVPIYSQGMSFVRTNVFYSPLNPQLPLSLNISWQANDPLLHTMLNAFSDRATVTAYRGDPHLDNLGWLNMTYEPWGGNPLGSSFSPTKFDASVKDPLVRSPDDWNFPSGQKLKFEWLGRVHRGTPWQTIYLKSSAVDLQKWEAWTGILDLEQARLIHPTNDWHLAALWADWLNTNPLASRFSINNSDKAAWRTLFDGFNVSSNTPTGQFDTVVSSNSTQAAILADSIQSAQTAHSGGFLKNVVDILSIPELSAASPWLETNYVSSFRAPSDEAYEALPTQLLPLLRADSIGSASFNGENCVLRFSGYSEHDYALQVSPDLRNWTSVVTNHLVDGVLTFTNFANTSSAPRFYRSALVR